MDDLHNTLVSSALPFPFFSVTMQMLAFLLGLGEQGEAFLF